MNMLKTCANCNFYHATLSEGSSSHFHIHDYCEKFGKLEKFINSSEELFFLNWYQSTYEQYKFLGFIEDEFPLYNDIETGSSNCWLFKEKKDTASAEEESAMLSSKKSNLHKALMLIDALLEHKIVIEEPDYKLEKITDATCNYLKSLKEKFSTKLKEIEKNEN